MNYADNFKFYRNGKLVPNVDKQFEIATEEELKWMNDSITVRFQIHRTDGSWGDESGTIPSNTKPGHLPSYVLFCKPNGSISRGDQLLSRETGEVQVREAVCRYLCGEPEEVVAMFAYL